MLRHCVQVTGAFALCVAAGTAAAESPPSSVDPFRLYGHFATRQLSPEIVVAMPPAG